MRVNWHNIRPRFWLWRHDLHHYRDLSGSVWTCCCGSSIRAGRPNQNRDQEPTR